MPCTISVLEKGIRKGSFVLQNIAAVEIVAALNGKRKERFCSLEEGIIGLIFKDCLNDNF